MHSGFRDVWTRVLASALTRLQGVSISDTSLVWVWKRDVAGQWTGAQQERPDTSTALAGAGLDALARELDEARLTFHPEYCDLVGTAALGLFNAGGNNHIRWALSELWKRYGSFAIPTDGIEALVDDAAAFIDSDRITVEFVAPVINFHADEQVSAI